MDQPRLTLARPLADVPGLGPVRLKALERLGLSTVGDLLTHYPRRYEDRRHFEHFPNAATDAPVCVCGIVVSTAARRLGVRRQMFEVTLQEVERHALSSLLTLRWFNAWYVQKLFAAGQRVVIYGKPKAKGAQMFIDHPEFEIIETDNDEESLIHLQRIVPIHAGTEGLGQRALRTIIHRVLQMTDLSDVETPLPAGLDPLTRADALRAIHFPEDDNQRERARRHLVLSEFFALQMLVNARRARTISRPGESHCGPGKLLDRFHDTLPFALTGAQWRCIGEIRGDLAAARPMNRLLQGDVGAGKTLVALSAMLLAVEAGFQTVLMAPTQILAEQHFLVFKRWLEPLGLRIALRTGSRREVTDGPESLFVGRKEPNDAEMSRPDDSRPTNDGGKPWLSDERPRLPDTGPRLFDERPRLPDAGPGLASGKPGLPDGRETADNGKPGLSDERPTPDDVPPHVPHADGLPDILIGTHALLFDKAPPPRLGLVVIDEQHKFGVLQRAALSAGRAVAPDILVMTATPIPRTLAITVYGDLDVSILDELPANRGKIITRVRPDSKLHEAGQFVLAQLAAGRQAYLVYPLIEDSEKLTAKAATVRFEHWKTVLAPYKVELLHGKMRPEEKDGVMRRFRDGEAHALVSTTVIEVGIDVKNANLMLIENAERFGLAQLHQLRGRIGRGEHKSYCLLMTDAHASALAGEKLRVLEDSGDGFVIAEADMKLRGPGDILGTAQSGLPPLKLGDLILDGDLMRQARTAAKELFEADPSLRREENRRFRVYLVESKKFNLVQVS